MKFFSVYGYIVGIAHGLIAGVTCGLIAGVTCGRRLFDISKFSIYEMVCLSISIAVTLGILMFMESLLRENEKKWMKVKNHGIVNNYKL